LTWICTGRYLYRTVLLTGCIINTDDTTSLVKGGTPGGESVKTEPERHQ